MTEKELRKLDAWIAEHVFEWTDIEFFQPPCDVMEEPNLPFWRGVQKACLLWQSVPCFTTDPAAAMMVLEKCFEKYYGIVINFEPNSKTFVCWYGHPVVGTYAETLPLAICLFAKKLFSK